MAAMDAAVETRSALIVTVQSILPKDFEVRGKSNKDILVAAIGDEIKDAETRSEDYLQAKVEGFLSGGRAHNSVPTSPEPRRPLPLTPAAAYST